jgi:Ferritin-like
MVRLQPQLAAGLDTPAGLQKALQTAVLLEHAALVPYLYSLYSLSPDENPDLFFRVKPIVMQQMGHMALACNVLNAIGGSPAIDDPASVPTYPGPLPGGVESELVVPLQAFSLDLVRQVFMEIEEPKKPLALEEHDRDGSTIADLYAAIGQRIMTLGESIFTGDPKRQVSGVLNVIEVTDRTSARIALETIVEQGQGTADSPTTAGGELAHYYRFAEIYHGRELVQDADGSRSWAYEGPPISFDPAGVLPVVSNPKASDYPVGSESRTKCDAFNATYTVLLHDLHAAFTGTPERLNDAIVGMFTLNEQAAAVMSVQLGDGTNAGPSFEYQTGT